ncbi:ThuA domain-containing protein [Pedosphaera parvula]|uniref:Heme-binding protein n=1 Tax=Pedosphaera parvula (strain Ellin514) TaxID=320771 RepID=B9XJ90_PEDPL|nr:ThuA domain-containing protein [Pedosphaera parvula]EEF60128.1 heme-binding protein [Pedosphaera parvula Ellin514]
MHLRFAILFAAAFLIRAEATQVQTNVSMLTPGFTVQQLPVRLSNVNNLRFTPDGKLTALGYDGRVHILLDTDGDGLEDKDLLYWDKSTLSVPVGMTWSKDGLYVSSHGKVSLLRDIDGDGKADLEEIVASGWPPTDVGSGGVDATAVTLDSEGNLYFGLLTADYSNPYRVKNGVSHYDLKSKRGTIQKWSPSTRSLETIATGIRVPYTLAFNRLGDLFVTDQEGETWCPGGNPLDELNQILPGRNYGFPPRHEKYLPALISEPPVVAFGPQHQSSCGLVFNEESKNHKSFGPKWWEGDAFVAGESRGKIWRVRLVKTPAGYVGRETVIARLNMLTMDVAISPKGDLYVSCHSGSPDWGTGPHGEGKLFKISYTDSAAPQMVSIWPAGPMEVRVAFDRAIDPSVTNWISQMQIDFGEYVSTADRLEVLKPPYKAVNRQEATPRGKLRVVATRLSIDHRTLILTTDPHPQSVNYALALPGIKAANSKTPATQIDAAYTLNGVKATWSRKGQTDAEWSGWFPHLDSVVNKAFTLNSTEHEQLRNLTRKKGILKLHTQAAFPSGEVTFRLQSSHPFELAAGTVTSKSALHDGLYRAELKVSPTGQLVPLSIALETGGNLDFLVHADYSLLSDPTVRPLPLNIFYLPWAPQHQLLTPVTEENNNLAHGDFENGRNLFFGQQLKCSTCHRIRGEGGLIGPDLSNLVHRDAASILRDIKNPNATINPDYVAYNVLLRDDTELTGFVRAQTAGLLRILDVTGKEHSIATSEIKQLQPSTVSLMPTGLLDTLKTNQVDDLLTFLLNEPPTSSASQVQALLHCPPSETLNATNPLRPLNIVLVAGKQDHPTGQHDYPAWQKAWAPLLAQIHATTVTNAWNWPTPQQFQQADVIMLYCWNHDWSAERYQQLDDFLARGGGLVLLHAATIADKDPEKLAERIGLAAQPGPTKYLHTPFNLKFNAASNQALTCGFKELHFLDEPYWPMFGDTNRIGVLATAKMEGQPRPMVWTYQRGKGRVFASIPGHYTSTLNDPAFRILILRGLAWTVNEPSQRFTDCLAIKVQ